MKRDLVLYQNIFDIEGKQVSSSLFSLSPSDSVIQNFDHEIATLLDGFKLSKKTIVNKSANEKSSVILFKYDDFTALLGADLEVTDNPEEGWRDICNNSVLINGKSIIYKIPHHGSSNAYNKELFEKLVEKDAILKLSPWNRNSKLPTDKMLLKYREHSPKVYITSP
ncbi:hypothetical protein IU405_00370, partial [Polaribacter sp. BAL334]|uniref:hypothetical protein n=1 Tax=Polaribacter sp. BAL334 TaxID=1708178 RepID=UPI0018D243EA